MINYTPASFLVRLLAPCLSLAVENGKGRAFVSARFSFRSHRNEVTLVGFVLSLYDITAIACSKDKLTCSKQP